MECSYVSTVVFIKMRKSILVIGALPSSLINFRGHLLKLLVSKGFNVTAMASDKDAIDKNVFLELGVDYQGFPVVRSGLNPKQDLETFSFLKQFIKTRNPDYVLAYTIKPVIWAGLATKFSTSSKFVAMITGLGFAFQPGGFFKNLLMFIVKLLYKFSLKNAYAVIFQNADNMKVFLDNKLVEKEKCFVVNGSGVDLSHYQQKPLPERPIFLMVARLLRDKGVVEYLKASSVVKSKYPDAEFHLVGPEDPSPDGLTLNRLKGTVGFNSICYHGSTTDVRPWLARCSVFVLPSYHEGMPRTVLEAMATGRPILTTNVVGCKETVVNGCNGWLVPKGSYEDLAERMIWFIENPEMWTVMASESVQIARQKFDVQAVNASICEILKI